MQTLWWAIYQGTVIMLLSALLFKEAFANVVLVVFCCLILLEWAQVYFMISSLTNQMGLMFISSALVYCTYIKILSQ